MKRYQPIYFGFVLTLVLLAFFAGCLFQRYVGLHRVLVELGLKPLVYTDVSQKQLMANPNIGSSKTQVWLLLGQSNAANHGASAYVASHQVSNFWRGEFYQAADPLLGASGYGGAMWGRLGDSYINRLKSSGDDRSSIQVVLVPVAVGETSIEQWFNPSLVNDLLIDTLQQVQSAKLKIDKVMWVQGETDNVLNTSAEAYRTQFEKIVPLLNSFGISSPLYLALSTRCQLNLPSVEIRHAVRQLVKKHDQLKQGPDLDELGLEYRFDGCHFTEEGMQRAVNMWLQVLI